MDHDAGMIAAADRRAAEAGVAAQVRLLVADATALPLPTASVEACRCERVFQHLPQPERAFAEMVRVSKPGGWIVVVDLWRGKSRSSSIGGSRPISPAASRCGHVRVTQLKAAGKMALPTRRLPSIYRSLRNVYISATGR